jgi:hypothetical protein
MERAVLDDHIRTARIIVQGPLHRGGGHPDKQLAVVEGGIGVVVKMAVPGDPVKQAQVRAERAAAVLAIALDWDDLVPATAFRVVESLASDDYVPASVQVVWPMFMPAVERRISASSFTEDEIWRVALFDALALNTDRHGGNWGTIEGMDQHPRLIDHGHAFDAAASGGFDFINLKRNAQIPDEYREHLLTRLREPGLPNELRRLRPQSTIQKIEHLIDIFVNKGHFLVP